MILSVFDERSKPAFAFIFFSKGGRLVGKYIAKRILSGVITIVILITACFFLMHAIPGSPFAKGEQGVPEAVMQASAIASHLLSFLRPCSGVTVKSIVATNSAAPTI